MLTKFILAVFSFLLFNNICQAQHKINILGKYVGDLNKDKIQDEIEIEEVKCKNNFDDDDFRQCRITRIFLGEKDGSKSFFKSNSNIVECSFCREDDADPFRKVKIRRNDFSFISEYIYYPRGNKMKKTVSFKYDKILKNFILYKIIQETEFYENGNIENKTQIETAKDFGVINFADYQ